jgi:hypothetical protein
MAASSLVGDLLKNQEKNGKLIAGNFTKIFCIHKSSLHIIF